MQSSNHNAETHSAIYHIQQTRKLLTRLNLSDSELETFLEHAFQNCAHKAEKCNCHQKSDSNPKPQTNHHADLTRPYKLDWLFHASIEDVVALPVHDLHKKQERAHLLVEWLGGLIRMKQEGADYE